MATFPKEPVPSYSSKLGYDNSNVKEHKTGDGEPVIIVHGVLRRKYNLVYKFLTQSEKDVLIDFYEANKNVPFDWYDIETDELKKAWFKGSPDVTFSRPTLYDVSLMLLVEEV